MFLSALPAWWLPMSNEANIEQKIILPLLKQWGYSDAEYQAKPRIGNEYPDFVVRLSRTDVSPFNYLIIEVKSPEQKKLSGSQQLKRYMAIGRTVFGLLTNGREYQLFYQNPLKEPLRQVNCCSGDLDKKALQKLGKLLHRSTATALMNALTHQQLKVYHHFEKELTKKFSFFISSIPAKEASMIITVFNHKGGVGKTTLTLNLGAAFAEMGKRVLLIDIDPQANLTIGVGIDPLRDVEEQGRKDISDLLLEPRVSLEEVIYRKSWDDLQLDVVPSHIRLADKEPALINTIDIDRVLQRKLSNHSYDVILIDPPPAFGKVNTIALMASHGVLIPTQLAPYPIRAIEYVLARLEAMRNAMENPPRPLGIAVSMYNRSKSAANQQMRSKLENILSKYGNTIEILPESTWIPEKVTMLHTINFGQPIFSEKLYHELRRDRNSLDDLTQSFQNLARYLSSKALTK
ncbi:AAA family ATPase [uncultured Thermosynechococcus sp.]|uniref:AAA family ATPase n=2 Tax=uncultured Thermosynechococcus sp. TaxID=436945 RepID=UPI00261673AC|nr:AAA family ATPase [uncultured Thermosynechococcus sp.]